MIRSPVYGVVPNVPRSLSPEITVHLNSNLSSSRGTIVPLGLCNTLERLWIKELDILPLLLLLESLPYCSCIQIIGRIKKMGHQRSLIIPSILIFQ